MKILFLDHAAPNSYNCIDLERRAMGGTESTVIRIAEALAQEHEVTVAQVSANSLQDCAHGVTYRAADDVWDTASSIEADVVVVLRKPKLLRQVRGRFPDARIILWAHDFFPDRYGKYLARAANDGVEVVCVSECLRKQAAQVYMMHTGSSTLSGFRRWKPLRITTIHNPIDDRLRSDGRTVDPNKLVFFSSPHKGLAQVLGHFRRLRETVPTLQLHIANPGYFDPAASGVSGEDLQADGIVIHGRMRQQDVIDEVRSALCVFYPQSVYPETFGLIYAEANAVGTPVLAHDFGAAREVLFGDGQLIDADDEKQVADTLTLWRNGARPSVACRNHFRLKTVRRHWEKLLAFEAPA